MSRRRHRHRYLVGFALVGIVVARGEPAAGGRITDFSQEEFHTLPRLCLAQRFINEELETPAVPEAERRQLDEKLGHTFIHYHHYCWALLLERRAAKPNGDKYDYRRAIDNLNYVIARAEPSFAPLPGVYFNKASVLERLGEREAALIEYHNALSVRPDFTPACAALVQLYLDLGNVEAARAVLEEGLKHAPSSIVLAEKKSALAKRKNESR